MQIKKWLSQFFIKFDKFQTSVNSFNIFLMILIILKRLGNMPYLAISLKTFLIISLLVSTSIFFLLKVNYAKSLKFQLQTIQIERTQFGIPYVKAPTFKSVMYGWGYVTAQDRLFQLAFKRLIGKGKLSKYLGKKAINVDKLFRQLNFPYWAEKTALKMHKQNITQYRHFQNYVKGINDQVQSLNFLPIQFYLIGLEWQPWTVADMFLQTKLLVWSQSQNMAEQYIRSNLLQNYTQQEVIDILPFGKQKWDIFNLIPIVTDDEIADNLPKWTHSMQFPKFNPEKVQDLQQLGIMQYIDEARGSNSWAIHGNHTQSGLPLVANDPHLQSAIPHQWHQIRIQYMHNEDLVYSQGSAMTGIPAIVGKSQYFSLALTTIHSDSQDLYKQKFTYDSTGKKAQFYELDGRQVKLKKRIQFIYVENEKQPVEHVVYETHRGPVISCLSHSGTLYQIDGHEKISLAWTGFHDQYSTWVANSHTAEINDLQDLKHFMVEYTSDGPNMNALYATIDNHIGYTAIGSLPIRRNRDSGNFIKDGTTTEHDWVGLIKKEAQLNLYDPKKGYIVTANNRPVSSKYMNGVYESSMMTARANRIDQLIRQKLENGKKLTVQDMKSIQLDTVDILCLKNMPNILEAVVQSRQYLTNFNCDFTKHSHQATIYEVFYYQLYKIINPDKVNNYNLMASLNYFSYLHRYLGNFAQQEVKRNMEEAFRNAIYNLTSFYGTQDRESWIWQKYHPDVIIHRPFSGSEVLKPFYEKRFGGRGNANTVNVAKMNKLSYGDFTVNHRANIRMIWTHAQNQKSFWIGDTGVSQKFYSKHYDDQFKLFTKDEYLQVNFNKKETENQQF